MSQNLTQILILQKGNCAICGYELGDNDTIQSTEVECSKCEKEIILCTKCKNKGCECGGRYLNSFDNSPGLNH